MEIKIPRDQSLEPSEVSIRPQQGRGQPAISQVLLSIAFWIWVALSGMVLALAALLLFVPFNPLIDRRRRAMDWISHLWGKGIMTMLPGVRLEVIGKDRLRTWNEPFVFCANHQSVADIPVLLSTLPHFKFVVKESLFWLFPIGLQLRLCGYVPAAKDKPGAAEQVFAKSGLWLRRGSNMLIFPEGTRSLDGRLLRFGQAAFALAQRSGVPVVPVAVSGTGRVIAKGRFLYDFTGVVRVEILEPLRVEGDPKACASRVRALIQSAIHDRGSDS
jgi:1-acyl-sn-glycerol-3-phosphate acyltransferase